MKKSDISKIILDRRVITFFFKKKKNNNPFFWMGFNCLKAIEPLRGDRLLFTTRCPKSFWYSIDKPGKTERLCQPSSHPVVLTL